MVGTEQSQVTTYSTSITYNALLLMDIIHFTPTSSVAAKTQPCSSRFKTNGMLSGAQAQRKCL